MTERQMMERLKKAMSKTEKKEEISSQGNQEKHDRKKRWMTYFRANPEIYIEKRMGFHSFGYQNFSYHMMGLANQYIEVSTRGVGKSLRVIAYATCRALLYPNSKIGITAVGASQASENYITAFMQEIVYKYSPFMKWLYDNKMFTARETPKGYMVTFWNGSVLYFFGTIDSSRGLHLDTLIGEELRLIKKSDWDSIAMPMLVARRAGFRNTEAYFDRKDLDEDTKVICITSNRTKKEWFNTMYNKTFVEYFKDAHTDNRVLSFDIFLALNHGLKKPQWYVKQKDEMGEVDFRCEILNETLGEVEGAYFTWEMFRKNQILQKGLRPYNDEEYTNGKFKNRPKDKNESRIMFVDFSFAGSTTINDNDNTVIGILSTKFSGGIVHRQVEYLEAHSGAENDNTLIRIREMFWDLEVDYIVMDNLNGGELNFNSLTKEWKHPKRNEREWNSHGFTVCNERDLHMVSDQKLMDLRSRTVDPQAVPCIIPITATKEWNSNMWLELSKRLRNEEISFLIDSLEFQNTNKGYLNMSNEEKLEQIMPYTQTTLLINEAVSLKQKWINGLLKLEEPYNGYKDRIVALAYGNYVATLLENKLLKEINQNEEIEIEDYCFVW